MIIPALKMKLSFIIHTFKKSSFFRRDILSPPFKINSNFPHAKRSLFTGKYLSSNYEGDGKTTLSSINKEYRHLVMIDSVSTIGFRLNNGIFTIGPLAIFPRTVLHWNVHTVQDINIDTLSLFYLLEPKIDILILGTGDTMQRPSNEVITLLKSKKISVEILNTETACSTFNFLNAEGRCVAGALIPPQNVIINKDQLELITSSIKDLEVFS